jgi:[ribosomal protein S5]-alanine N-acetyltransferase
MIETERLILRHWSIEDVPWVAGIYGDPETMKWFGSGVTFSPEQLTESLKHVIEEYAYAGLGNHAVVEKESLAVIGHCGVHRGSDGKEGEADWLIARDRWSRGYATEAAVAVISQAFREANLPGICAVARRENLASIEVMRKLRMSFAGECDRDGSACVIYRVAREDFGRHN